MNCEEARKLLPAMVLGDLEGSDRDRLVEHAKGCEGCRAERAHLEHVLSAAKRLPAPEPSGARRERVVAAMAAAAEEPRAAEPRRRWGPMAAAAAVLLAVAGTWAGATGRLGFLSRDEAYGLKAEEIKGEALLMRAGGSTWEPLTTATDVKVGDRVLTNGGRVWFRSTAQDLIVLADGTQVMINRADPRNPSVMLVYGEIWAEVTPRKEGNLRFESPEGEGSAEVIGTKLHLEYR